MSKEHGRLFDLRDAEAFRRGRSRSWTCALCGRTLLLKIPANAFLCGTSAEPGCDWTPDTPGALPPRGFQS